MLVLLAQTSGYRDGPAARTVLATCQVDYVPRQDRSRPSTTNKQTHPSYYGAKCNSKHSRFRFLSDE
jgi:hypothetical protein